MKGGSADLIQGLGGIRFLGTRDLKFSLAIEMIVIFPRITPEHDRAQNTTIVLV